MVTLKDIKISKTRIPLQNAIWLRPIGGLQFKVYYPHGGDWAELKLGSSSSDDSSGKTTPTPSKQTVVVTTTSTPSWEPIRVIVCRCIPMYARVGAKYYFADGRIKFKVTDYTGFNIFTYGYTASGTMEFTSYPTVPLLRKNNFDPILVTIRSEEDYNNDWKRVKEEYGSDASTEYMNIKVFETLHKNELTKVFYSISTPRNLTCDTTSPHFKVIDGHVRNVCPARMPIVQSNYYSARGELKHFRSRSPKPQKVRKTKKFYLVGNTQSKITTFRKAWRLNSLLLAYEDFRATSNKRKHLNYVRNKVYKIWEYKKNRLSAPRIVRRTSGRGINVLKSIRYEPYNWV